MNSESSFSHHEPCPQCASKDNLARFSDGHGFCFGCEYYETGTGEVASRRNLNPDLITNGEYVALGKRMISEETCQKYRYALAEFGGKPCQVADYFNAAGEVVAQKVRFADKTFTILGDMKQAGLYGSHLFGKGKMVVITEGEIDALSVAEIQHCKWPVLSVPNGAAGAKKAIAKSLDYLSQFESIVLMFDNDGPGTKAAAECAEVLGPKRCKIATLPLKDANEMLQAGRSKEIIEAMWNARPYQPEGVISGADLLELVLTEDSSTDAIPYPWQVLNDKTYGLRTAEIVLFAAGSGVGKSAVVRELGYYLGNKQGRNVGWIMLEESTKRTALGLLSLHKSLPLHIPEFRAQVDREEMTTLFNETLGTDRYFLIDHFGSTDPDTLMNRIRYLVTGRDCRWIILDHISMVVSGIEDGDERRIIDNIMTRLRTLVEELNFGLILITHLTRPKGEIGHENGAEITLRHLRGSHALAQLSDIIIGVERDQQGDMPNLSTLRVLKNRFSGETGVAGYLAYEKATGRLTETTLEFADRDTAPEVDFTKSETPSKGEDF